MNSTREISVHTPNGWETLKVPFHVDSKEEVKKLTSASRNYEWFSLSSPNSISNTDYYRSVAFACINARAEKVNTAVLKLQYEQSTTGKMKDIVKHPFWDLASNPNIYKQSFKELIYLICVSLDLYPNGAFLYYPRNAFNMPAGLYHLPSKHVSFELTTDGTQIKRYRFSQGSNIKYYNPEEIIHFKIPNPDNPIFSKSTAGAAALTLDAELYQLLYQKNFYLNDASIGGIFTVPGKLDEDQYTRLDNQVRDKFTGPEKAGNYFIGEGGLEFDKSTATPREADYSKSHIDTRNEVCGLFRTPKSILGFVDDVNRANAEASNLSFLKNTIIPFSFHIWDKLEQFIKVNYDERIWLIPEYRMEESMELQTADFDKGYKKWWRPNEIRAAKGLPEDWSAEDEETTNVKPNNNEEDTTAQ